MSRGSALALEVGQLTGKHRLLFLLLFVACSFFVAFAWYLRVGEGNDKGETYNRLPTPCLDCSNELELVISHCREDLLWALELFPNTPVTVFEMCADEKNKYLTLPYDPSLVFMQHE